MGSMGSRLVVSPTPGVGWWGSRRRHEELMLGAWGVLKFVLRFQLGAFLIVCNRHTHTHAGMRQFTGIQNDTASSSCLTLLTLSLLLPWAMSPQAFALCLFFSVFYWFLASRRDTNLIVVSIFELHMRASNPTISLPLSLPLFPPAPQSLSSCHAANKLKNVERLCAFSSPFDLMPPCGLQNLFSLYCHCMNIADKYRQI